MPYPVRTVRLGLHPLPPQRPRALRLLRRSPLSRRRLILTPSSPRCWGHNMSHDADAKVTTPVTLPPGVLHPSTLHPSTFEYLRPNGAQLLTMDDARAATRAYARALEALVPPGPDKTYILRKLRELAMWVNVAITREPDGTPRL